MNASILNQYTMVERDYRGFSIAQTQDIFCGFPKARENLTGNEFQSALIDWKKEGLYFESTSSTGVRGMILESYKSSNKYHQIISHLNFESETGLPELIEIEPTENCNLRCIMCHMSKQSFSHDRLEIDKMMSHIEVLRGKWICVGGSFEPTLHPGFCDLMLGLSELDANVGLVTNASLITPRISSKLSTLKNIRNVTFSFDGISKEIYESIRTHAKFGQTLDRIQEFKKSLANSNPFFTINYVAMVRNLEECLPAVEFWEKLGMDALSFISMFTHSKNDALSNELLAPSIERYTPRRHHFGIE